MKYKQVIKDILTEASRPMLSSELQEQLMKVFPELKNDNARKQLSLCSEADGIYKSEIKFKDGQFAYDTNPLDSLNHGFFKLVSKEKPLLARVINRLTENNGIIPYTEIMKLCACPSSKDKSKTKGVLEIISELNFVISTTTVECKGQSFLKMKNISESQFKHLYNKIIDDAILDCKFIPSILIWLQKNNIMSPLPRYKNKNTPFQCTLTNNLLWDASGFTNATGFLDGYSKKSEEVMSTPCFLEIKVSSPFTKDDLMGFYDRLQIVINSASSKRKILSIIITKEVSVSIEREIKNLNILHFNIATIFGERIYEIVDELKLIYSYGDINEQNIASSISRILTKINEAGQDTNLSNIKGELFERIMTDAISFVFNKKSDIITPCFMFGDLEYDILIETSNEYIVVELKGWKSKRIIPWGKYNESTGKPEKETLKWFFDYKYPEIKKHLRENFNKSKPVRACYITTAKYEYAGEEKMKEMRQTKITPTEIDLYYDGVGLIKFLRERKIERDADIIERFYMSYEDSEAS